MKVILKYIYMYGINWFVLLIIKLGSWEIFFWWYNLEVVRTSR